VRILVVTDQWFPDVGGGAARVATETAQHLAQRGHELTVLAPHVSGRDQELREGNLRVLRVLDRHRLPQSLIDAVQTWRLARRQRGRGFDVSVAHQTTVAVGLGWAGIDAPRALVFHASPVRESRFLRSRARSPLARVRLLALEALLRPMERLAVRNAEGVLVLSNFSRRIVIEDHPEAAPRVLRVSGGVDTSSFTPGGGMEAARRGLDLPTDARVLLTVRRLEPRMGLEMLLNAVAQLGSGIDVVIAGTGSLERDLRGLAEQLGLASRARFLGRVADAELADWYRAADLFVLPTAAYEGFGMATVEALASGTPVVGTPVGATPELLGPLEPRLIAERADVAALAEAIRDTLPLARGELRTRARRYAEESFSWSTVAPEWEDALRVVAGSPASPGRGQRGAKPR
jgi:glycosyltransferase involved in cell wall biosynthesis